MRATIACPQELIPDANQLAMALGLSANDVKTFTNASLQDSNGALYAVASFPITQAWLDKVNAALVRPSWDGELIDMVAANRAKALFEISQTPAIAQSDKITGCIGDSGITVIEAMGLYAVENEL